MKQSIVVFGSTNGTCEDLAGRIAAQLGVECVNVSELSAEVVAAHDNLILGSSTWGAGDLQDDWYEGVALLSSLDLSGKTVALFGCGDCESYGDTFCGALAEIHAAVTKAGATVVGQTDVADYSFQDSAAVIDGKFVGLALDEDNQAELSDARIEKWVALIKPKL